MTRDILDKGQPCQDALDAVMDCLNAIHNGEVTSSVERKAAKDMIGEIFDFCRSHNVCALLATEAGTVGSTNPTDCLEAEERNVQTFTALSAADAKITRLGREKIWLAKQVARYHDQALQAMQRSVEPESAAAFWLNKAETMVESALCPA